jgi:hypothetical protein
MPSTIQQNDTEELQDTNIKLEEILSRKENDSYSALPSPGQMASTMSEFIIKSLVKNTIKVLLDCKALMLEMNNEQVASKWLELCPSIEGVVFLNDKNTLTVKMSGQGKTLRWIFLRSESDSTLVRSIWTTSTLAEQTGSSLEAQRHV